MEKIDLFKISIQTRNFEISMFWQRSNYFMALNTAIAIGFFTQNWSIYATILASLGFIVSILWFRVNLAGKFWQSRWEYRVALYEKDVVPDADLFAANKETVLADVENNLAWSQHKGFHKWVDQQILKKRSVTYQLTCLSFFFICFWLLLFAAFICTPNQ